MKTTTMLCALVVLFAALPGSGYGAGDDLATTLRECRQLVEADARLTCYDRMADSLVPQDEVREMRTAAEPAVAPSPPPPKPVSETAAVESAPAATAPVRTPAEPDPAASEFGRPPEHKGVPDAIVVTIRSIDRTAYGKLILELDNDQIWLQLDSVRTTLRVGDEVRISSAMSGSFLLRKSSGGTSIRVRRVDG